MIGIYKITNPKGKVYIGQSINIEKRRRDYEKLKCRNQVKLYNSLTRYGFPEHVFEIVEHCNVSELNMRERYWQDYYNVLEDGLNLMLTDTQYGIKIYSKETRERMSNSHKGVEPWNKGLPHTVETRDRISRALQGREVPQEIREKISKTRLKQPTKITEETREKLREARQRREVEPMQGKKHTEETKQKMSKAAKGVKKTEEHKQKISATLKGRTLSEETKKKMSESKKKRKI